MLQVETHEIKIKSNRPDEFWLSNAYLTEISTYPYETEEYMGRLTIIDSITKFLDKEFSYVPSFAVRDKLVRMYAWAIPTEEALKMICKYSPIVEIGAGTGYWASLLKAMGADVICYDLPIGTIDSISKFRLRHVEHIWHPINLGNEESVRKHDDRTLFLCWPPYDEPMAYNCLKKYRGKTVVYIGEGQGMCTGDDRFHRELNTKWNEVESCEIVVWTGIYDRLTVYTRM
jgi:hypothetical protein